MTYYKNLPIILDQIHWAEDHIWGGFENAIADGYINPDGSEMKTPSFGDMIGEIYLALRHCKYGMGFEQLGALEEILDCPDQVMMILIANSLIIHGYPINEED